MIQRLIQRSISTCLAAAFTLAMLGVIDHLATADTPAAGWAARAAPASGA